MVMAVHNGAAMLPAQLEHLLSLEPHLVREVIVVSDGSTDGTAQILADRQHRPLHRDRPRASRVAKPRHSTPVWHAQPARSCSSSISGRAWPTTRCELLVSNFADPTVGCVAGELLLNTAGHDATASAVSGVYWKYEQAIRNCEAAFDSPVGVYGGFYAVRRTLLHALPRGHHSGRHVPAARHHPPGLPQRARSPRLRERHLARADRRRVPAQGTNPGRQLSAVLARSLDSLAGAIACWFQLVSHKLLRLVVPYLFAITLLTATWLGAASMGWRIVALAQAFFWIAALLSTKMRLPVIGRFASAAGALLVLNAAAVVGLYKFLFTTGPLWKIWSAPSTSARNPLTLEARRGRA